jgi:hypothetical protein
MMRWAFLILLISATAFSLLRGKAEHRIAVLSILVASVGTYFLYKVNRDWLEPQLGIFLVEATLLVVLLAIMLRSKRYWPLPVAAFQTVPVLVHIAALFGYRLNSYAVGVAQGTWAFLQLGIILAAVYLDTRRRRLMTSKSYLN